MDRPRNTKRNVLLVLGALVVVCLLGFAVWAALQGLRVKITPQEEAKAPPPVVLVQPSIEEVPKEVYTGPPADPQWISIPAAGIENHVLTAELDRSDAASPAFKEDDTEFINWYAGGGRLGQDLDDPQGPAIEIYCHTSDWEAICDDVQLLGDEDLGAPLLIGNNETGQSRYEYVGAKIVHRDDIGADPLYNANNPLWVKVIVCWRLNEDHVPGTPSMYRMIAVFEFVEFTPIDEVP